MTLDPGCYLDSALPRTSEEQATVLLELVEDTIDERTAGNLRVLYEPFLDALTSEHSHEGWAPLFQAIERALAPHLPPCHACGWVDGDWCVYELDADMVAA
jgi:hypothetical protein